MCVWWMNWKKLDYGFHVHGGCCCRKGCRVMVCGGHVWGGVDWWCGLTGGVGRESVVHAGVEGRGVWRGRGQVARPQSRPCSRWQGRRVDASRTRGRNVWLTVFRVGVAVWLFGVVIAIVVVGVGTVSGPAVLGVGLDVFWQVVWAHESLVADGAGETFLPGVGPQVPLQFVTPGKPLSTKQPVANKGALSGVPPQMGLQVGGLAIDLAATGDVTTVNVPLPQMGPSWS